MINFIESILRIKKIEIFLRKKKISKNKLIFISKRISLVFPKVKGIFGEFKQFSPIKGLICKNFKLVKILKFLLSFNIENFSVLTDQIFFGGNYCNIPIIISRLQKPIIRKDFMISSYQIYESFVIGGKLFLIIVFILSKKKIEKILNITKMLKCLSILEIFDKKDIKKIYNLNKKEVILGLNNRSLKNFKFKKSFNLVIFFKKKRKVMLESNINSFKKIFFFKKIFNYFLIGEFFMKKYEEN